MKIAIIGANGRVGQLIINEALEKHLDVVAVVRNENKTVSKEVIIKDLFDLNKEDIKDVDVLVNCFGTKDESKFDDFKNSIVHLSNLIENTDKRLIVVGGAGSLYLDETFSKQLFQNDDFPDFVRPTAEAAAKALAYLRDRNNVLWTYISPTITFDHKGNKLGTYKVAGEVLTFNDKGESYISYADYALALVDEIVNAKYIQKRISFYQ